MNAIAAPSPAPPAGSPAVTIGDPIAFSDMPVDELLAAAAAGAPFGTADPVDRATLAAASERADLRLIEIVDYAPPTACRRCGIATVHGLDDGPMRIARGRVEAVLKLCRADRETIARAIDVVKRLRANGFRPWAIARARGSDGGGWEFLGVIPIHVGTGRQRGRDGSLYIFVRFRSFAIRFLHWYGVILITILIVTGLEMEQGFLAPETTRLDTGFYFGYVRLTHYTCGWLLTAGLIAGFAHTLLTTNRYENWKSLIPLKSLKDVRSLFATLYAYVTFRTDEGEKYIGNYPLNQLAFCIVYLMLLGSMVTGFALYGLYDPTHWFFGWFQWLIDWLGGNHVRLIHVLLMWGVIIFVPLHIYLIFRGDGYDREGALSSMISGGRWLRKGARFVDE